MPVIRSGTGRAPAWSELDRFEIVRLAAGEARRFARSSPQEKLILAAGRAYIAFEGKTVNAEPGTNLDLSRLDSNFEVRAQDACMLVLFCGRWGAHVGGSGLFSVENSPAPKDGGDPVAYPKQTNFDCHYHDCDEFWVLLEGRGVAISENRRYEVAAGDCVATGRGHHHDFPIVHAPVRAVYFETSLEGQKRVGHLWDHTHGPAVPCLERV